MEIEFSNKNNNKRNFNIINHNYINDEELFIAIDGKIDDDLTVSKIKEMYKQFKEKIVYKIDGFFSVYIYDKKKDIVLLIKDRIGLKPIYYCMKNKSIYCGNDVIELVNKFNIKKIINIDALSMYFRYQYINPPQTIFKNIFKVEHGHYIIIKNNHIYDNTYWDIIEKYNCNSKKLQKDFNIAKKSLNNILCSNIKNIVAKEDNYGIYLSGGIDSSLVAALCKKYSKNKVNTFSIGFYEDGFNEAEKSKKIAEYLGTNHHELYVDEKMVLEVIKKIPKYYTEPFADTSELPTIILNEYAKENNIKVAITGDGADQLFCGCNINDMMWRFQKAYKILNPLHIKIKSKRINNWKRILYLAYSNTDKKYQAQCDILYSEIFLDGLFEDNGQKRFEEEKINSKNWQEKRLIIDFDNYACDRLTTKMGVVANKNNIEIRSPFYNKDLVEYSFHIPHKYKYFNRTKKYILKQVLFDYIPKEMFSNEKKGFGIPARKWLKTCLYNDLIIVSNKEFIDKQKIFNFNKLQELIKDIDNYKVTQILWNFYMFQLWYEEYINDNSNN